MTQQHPITPPPELVEQWYDAIDNQSTAWKQQLATRAAQWGADQELEACCAFAEDQSWGLVNGPHVANVIRAARRPKPPSLKEQALEALMTADGPDHPTPMLYLRPDAASIIRRALESIPDPS